MRPFTVIFHLIGLQFGEAVRQKYVVSAMFALQMSPYDITLACATVPM